MPRAAIGDVGVPLLDLKAALAASVFYMLASACTLLGKEGFMFLEAICDTDFKSTLALSLR